MLGKALGQYCVIEQLGAGGMGVVYRAHDERLDRDVALKVLPASALTDETARKRFRAEALALSKLNHPNIATIFDFDSLDGVDFLVMELVQGESLAQKVLETALTEKEISALGGQIADALEDAHEHGVVHRDLKPANILVTPKGRVKVLDFGLAKLLRPAAERDQTASLALTQNHTVVGTLPYMAPEQLEGHAVDARTDLYAFGAVLYQMATGQQAFQEKLSTRLVSDILHSAPVAPRARNPRISAELERIILKCLEKNPDHRYQSAKEVGVDLRRLLTAASTSAVAVAGTQVRRGRGVLIGALVAVLVAVSVAIVAMRVERRRPIDSLAVLPFTDEKADPAIEYLDDGLTESLINSLSQLPNLKVMSRNAVFRFKGKDVDAQAAGHTLGVRAVLTGRIVQRGDKISVRAELVDAQDNSHLWGEQYNRTMADLVSLEGAISRDISEQLRLRLTRNEQSQLVQQPTRNAEAYQLYLQGRYFWNKKTGPDHQKAIEYYQQAIAKDSSYALAYVGLAECYALLTVNADDPPNEYFPKSKQAALRALEIDPQSAEAHAALGFGLYMYDWDFVGAEREFQRASSLNPKYPDTHYWYTHLLASLGRSDEAIAEARRGLEADPLDPTATAIFGRSYFYAHRYDEAVEQLQKAVKMAPNFWVIHLFLGLPLTQQKKYAEALEEFRKAGSFTSEAASRSAYVYALSGKKAEAQAGLKDLLKLSKSHFVPAFHIARIYMGLGDRDSAFTWLSRACDEHDLGVLFLEVDPELDTLRSDPRFKELVKRVGLPQ